MITKEHRTEVCKLGQGHDCCRYLACGSDGFECLKGTICQAELDRRATSGTMTARGDNCDGEQSLKRSLR